MILLDGKKTSQNIRNEIAFEVSQLLANGRKQPHLVKNDFNYLEQIPTSNEVSNQISIDLKKRGFKFVGPKIVYAYMQAVGMVNDHLSSCFRYNLI